MNNTIKWLRYLLYVGIAAMINSILGIFLPAVSNWLTPVLTLAALFMMSRLIPANGRYIRAILFTGVSLVITVLNIQAVALAGSICSLVGQYQEYTAHGELVAAQDPKLAGRWGSLFWLQFAVSIITTLLGSVLISVLMASGAMDADTATIVLTIAVSFVILVLRLLHLNYLSKTIKLLETETVA